MRGRLIQRFKAKFARIDTSSIRDDGFYDDDFREVVKVQSGDGIGTIEREEHDEVTVPCQIPPATWEGLRSTFQGNAPTSTLVLYLHMKDLEALGLIDATTKEPLIHVGDRLVEIDEYVSGNLALLVKNPPGLFITEARPAGFGLNMSNPQINLLRVTLEPRSKAL